VEGFIDVLDNALVAEDGHDRSAEGAEGE